MLLPLVLQASLMIAVASGIPAETSEPPVQQEAEELSLCGPGVRLTLPVAFGTRDDGWPRRLRGVGVVDYCEDRDAGFGMGYGKVRIRLQSRPRGYRSDDLLLVMPFGLPYTYCGKTVKVTARKLLDQVPRQYFETTSASGSVPWYFADRTDLTIVPPAGNPGAVAPNPRVNAPVHPVTAGAHNASGAPVLPARYADC